MRDGQHVPLRHRDFLRVTAARQQRAHLLADLPPGDAGTDGGDGAAALEAERRGRAWWRPVTALSLQQVGTVDGRRRNVEHDLAGLRFGVGEPPTTPAPRGRRVR